MASHGPFLATSNTAASIAPETVNANAVMIMDRLVHVANVGRERGRESPIPLSPMIATRAGRNTPSTKLCTEMSCATIVVAAPRIPYSTSREPVAPAIAPTAGKNSVPPNRVAHDRSGNRTSC